MKGGKRLSEEERIDMGKLVLWAQERLYLAREGTQTVRAGALNEIERTLKRIASYLERDDEPEYCTCGSQPYGTVAVVDNGVESQRCFICGKPVKGE